MKFTAEQIAGILEGEVVGNDAEQVVNQVSHVEEAMPLHEYAIPDEMGCHVRESDDLEGGVAL